MEVTSAQEASILSNEYTWTVLQILHEIGGLGLTSLEIHEKVEKVDGGRVAKSKVYGLIKRLYELEMVHKMYDQTVKSHRYSLAIHWGEVAFDDEFFNAIFGKLNKEIGNQMFDVLEGYLKRTMESISKNKDLKKWLPGKSETWVCRKCHVNHEAEEFTYCLLNILLTEYINSEKYAKFMKDNGFANQDYK